MKITKLNEETMIIVINTRGANINIKTTKGDLKVETTDNIEKLNMQNIIAFRENYPCADVAIYNNNNNVTLFGKEVFNSCTLIDENRMVVNGEIITGANIFISGDYLPENRMKVNHVAINQEINLMLAENKPYVLNVLSVAGNVNITDLNIQTAIIDTTAGNVVLNNVVADELKIESISGKIDASIADSIINCKTEMKSVSGTTCVSTTETVSPEIEAKKKLVKAKSTSGNIHISFKGKEQK